MERSPGRGAADGASSDVKGVDVGVDFDVIVDVRMIESVSWRDD